MTPTLIALIGTAVITPVVTLVTIWINSRNTKEERTDRKIDGYINDLQQEVADLKTEVRTIKIELKNRDADYVLLYQENTTLKAKYENLQIEHDHLRKLYDNTATELAQLKEDIKVKASEAADSISKI